MRSPSARLLFYRFVSFRYASAYFMDIFYKNVIVFQSLLSIFRKKNIQKKKLNLKYLIILNFLINIF